MHSPQKFTRIAIAILLTFALGQAKIIDTCEGLVTKQTPYCGGNGHVPNDPNTSGTWATANPLHCRDICLNAEDPNSCQSYRWDPIEGGYCIFYGKTLQQLGYQPNNVSSTNVTWYNRSCFKKDCYRYCSFAPHPKPLWRPGGLNADPSMEFPADQKGQFEPPILSKCQPNAYPYDGTSFTRIFSGQPGIQEQIYPGQLYMYESQAYYRLVNLTLKAGDKKASCNLFLGGTKKTFNAKTVAPMKMYGTINFTGEVNVDFPTTLSLYASCTEGSSCALDVDRFTFEEAPDSKI